MSDLIKADALYQSIGEVISEDDVRGILAKLAVVKEILEAADRFREESIKYARYEALALIRAMEVSGDSHLIKGRWRKKTAEWLVTLDEYEREEMIAKCSDGKTIDNVYRDVVADPAIRNALSDAVNDCKNQAREALRQDGVVVVPDIVRKYQRRFPRAMVKEITDGVRDSVRRAGGVGIGDDNGTYIDPDRNTSYVSEAMATRIAAVARDVESIADLAERCERKPVFRIKGNGEQISFVDVTYMILAGIGCAHVKFDTASARQSATTILRQIAGEIK